jgi:hypothetical protein
MRKAQVMFVVESGADFRSLLCRSDSGRGDPVRLRFRQTPDGDLGMPAQRYESARRRLQGGARAGGYERGRNMRKGPLDHEVRQSLSLIVMTAVTTAAYLGLGLLAVHLLG